MIQRLFAAAIVVCMCLSTVPAMAQLGQGNSPNYLFPQYTTPAGPNMTTAGMYPAPHNVLQLGAQSYYTYQPLMPHEMMYQHNRNYYNYYNSGGFYGECNDSLNKTTVRWQSGINHMGNLPWGLHCGKHIYRHQARKYGLNQNCGNDCNGDCGNDCGGNCGGKCGGKCGGRHHRLHRHRLHHRSRGCSECASCDSGVTTYVTPDGNYPGGTNPVDSSANGNSASNPNIYGVISR